MPINITIAQDAMAQAKIGKRLEKIKIAATAPEYRWELVKSWLAVRKRKGAKLEHIKAKYRPVALKSGVTRAELLEAGIPFCLTVDLGLA